MQLKRNWTQRYHWYPKPLAIRQQKTRLVHKHQPGNPRRRCYPCQGAAKSTGFFYQCNLVTEKCFVLRYDKATIKKEVANMDKINY